MLKVDVDPENKRLLLEPEGRLSRQDFVRLAQRMDPVIDISEDLNGLSIHANFRDGAVSRHSSPISDSLKAITSI